MVLDGRGFAGLGFAGLGFAGLGFAGLGLATWSRAAVPAFRHEKPITFTNDFQ